MSISEYVAGLDEDQLVNLIDKAKVRLEAIRKSGWVNLWTVSVGWANLAWFPESEHGAAVAFAVRAISDEAEKRPGKKIELEIRLECVRPEEVIDLLGRKEGSESNG
jgi:hypothetical protein